MKSAFFTIAVIATLAWVIYTNVHFLDTTIGLLDSVFTETATKMEMYRLAGIVRKYYAREGQLPATGGLARLIAVQLNTRDRETIGSVIKDTWGNSYRMKVKDRGFTLYSAGPDERWGTADDLKYYQTLADVTPAPKPRQRARNSRSR